MKHIIKITVYIISITCLLICSGCTSSKKEKLTDPKNVISSDFGLVETTATADKSFISFYNDKIEKIGESEVKYGEMGSFFSPPQVYKNNMYVIPQGIDRIRDLKFIFNYDLNSGKTKKYDLDLYSMNSFCIDDTYLIGVNTINFDSNISRLNIGENSLKKITIQKEYVSEIFLNDKKLYAFSRIKTTTGRKAYLYVIDAEKMEIQRKDELNTWGYSIQGICKIDNILFLPNGIQTSSDGKTSMPSNILTKYETQNNTYTNILLQYESPFQIVQYKRKLFISHYDPVQSKGKNITIFDLDTKEQKSITMKYDLGQIAIKKDKLYTINVDGNMQIYQINADYSFSLLREKNIKTKKNESTYFYIGGFFLNSN